jgi:flagellar hook-length control protein FliK
VPHVASDLNAQSVRLSFAPSARPSFSSDRAAPPTPFDSLIDDSLPPPAPEPRASARDDNSPRTDRNDPNQAQASDRPDRPARSDDRSTDASDAPTKTDPKASADPAQPTKEAKNSKDAKASVEKTAADTIKDAAGDAATTDAPKTADAGAAAVPAQTPVAAAVTVAAALSADAVKPAVDDGAIDAGQSQKAQLDLLAALQGEAGGKLDAKLDGKAGLQEEAKGDAKADNTDKKAAGKTDAAKSAPLTPAGLDTAAKTQGNGEADKDSTAHAQAKSVADTHRGFAPDEQAKTAPDDKTAAPKVTLDATQPTLPTSPTQPAQAPAATAAAAATPAPATHEAAVPLNGIGIEIASKALSGKNQFDIRLDPPDLGHIHVRLDVDKDGNVITHMVADRTDTLDMLRRDSAGLERALQDAGLKTSDNGMQFSLRDQSADQQQSGGERGGNIAHLVVDDEQVATSAVARDYGRYGVRAGGLDISV